MFSNSNGGVQPSLSMACCKIQDAGADALELNIFLNPMDIIKQDYEKIAIKIIKKVLKAVSIPISIKLSDCYTNLSRTIIEISNTGIAGLVLFNKFYSPDIDIYNLNIVSGRMHSCENEYVKPLRWIALLAENVKCSLAASTGIHNGNTVVKQILAGADAVQVVSALYLNGKNHIAQMLGEIEKWMFEKGIFSVEQFKGKAGYRNNTNPAVYERIQFMKHYGRIV
ncbi:Dihydroorotate dehydrogenase [subsurface metagenome]